MRRAWIAVLLIISSVTILRPVEAQAGGGGGGGPCAGFATRGTLVMRDSCFDGVAHFADADSKLEVRNEGILPHSFTAVDGSFDTGLIGPGETSVIDLRTPGIIQAFCTLHGTAEGHGMAGVLIVGSPNPFAGTSIVLAGSLHGAQRQHEELLRAETESLGGSLMEVKLAVEGLQRGIKLAVTALAVLGVLVLSSATAIALHRKWRPGFSQERHLADTVADSTS